MFKKQVIDFGIYEQAGNGLDIVIHFDEKLEELLNTIISFQDIISPSNYKKHIRQIMKVCPNVDAVLGEQGEQIIPIIDEDDESGQGKKKK